MIATLFIIMSQYILGAQSQVDVPPIHRAVPDSIEYTHYETVNPLVATPEELHDWFGQCLKEHQRCAPLPRLECAPQCEHSFARQMESDLKSRLREAREASVLHKDKDFGPTISALTEELCWWSLLETVTNKENSYFTRRLALHSLLELQ